MYSSDVIRKVAQETRLSQKIVSEVLMSTHRVIETTLRQGGTVVFPGFGTFRTSLRQAGTVPNPRTGEPIEYPERQVAVFSAGEILKRAVRGENRRGGASRRKH